MAGILWTWGIDYKNQPLLDAWWTPGWTAQNRNTASILVPPNVNTPQGFPQNLNYVTVTGNYFDASANPTSGYLTFWPSSALTITQGNNITYLPQRYSGINETMLGLNQMGDSKIYLWYGQLTVSLLATDNANMSPASFTYHVKEHYKGGLQYDIVVPSADVSSGADIHNLIIPGSTCPVSQEIDEQGGEEDFISIAVSSSQYIAVDLTTITAGLPFTASSYPVQLAFIAGPAQPASNQWQSASWANSQSPFVAQFMVGPNGYALSPGTYKIWARIIAPPQEPVLPVGYVEIY